MSKYLDTDQEAFDRIRAGLTHWRKGTEVIRELILEAKDREIWRLKYDSWSEFCELECGISKRWANRLIEADKMASEIAEFSDVSATKSGKPVGTGFPLEAEKANDSEKTAVPTNEIKPLAPKQVAALKGLSTAEKASVLEAAKAKTGTTTPKAIEAAKKKLEASKAFVIPSAKDPDAARDSVGRVIPIPLLGIWNRRNELSELMAKISAVRGPLKSAMEAEDDLFGDFNFSTHVTAFNRAYTALKGLIPFAVCTTCQGLRADKCTFCKGRGFISEQLWNDCVPIELKAIIQKANQS